MIRIVKENVKNTASLLDLKKCKKCNSITNLFYKELCQVLYNYGVQLEFIIYAQL